MKKILNKGDVIRTNPKQGCWGIAIVLSERDKTPEFHPMCHIAITPLIFEHEVTFDELKIEELNPLEFERGVRLKPGEEYSRRETLIGVYTRKNKTALDVIGRIDPSLVYDGPLPFSPDYGLEITWPLCGEISNHLGAEAVVVWRRIHDAKALKIEVQEANKSHDELMAKLKQEEREKRKNAKLKKNTWQEDQRTNSTRRLVQRGCKK